MTYSEAEQLLAEALKFGIDPSLEPITAMCEAMGNPQLQYKCIQVAGTNGKTSTARLSAALLRACGLHVGLYTSPHLIKYPERIEVDGRVVSDELFAQGIEAALEASKQAGVEATEFELLTAAALWIFAHEHVDWAVLECGLGGRWDATSVVNPQVAVITGVGLDHTHILGNTLEEIAAEKSAIIKPGSVAVFASNLGAREVFEAQAAKVGAPIVDVPPIIELPTDTMSSLPAYQAQNIATAITVVSQAIGRAPSNKEVRQAIADVRIPGRFEVLSKNPLVIIDAAHNPQSAEMLAGELKQRFKTAVQDTKHTEDVKFSAAENSERQAPYDKPPIPTLLLGVLADKDVRGIIRALVPLFSRVVVTASSSPRSISAQELVQIVEEECGIKPEVTSSIPEAYKLLSNESIIATGSITVAGEVKDIWC